MSHSSSSSSNTGSPRVAPTDPSAKAASAKELAGLQQLLLAARDHSARLEQLCLNLESHVVELTQEHDRAVTHAAAALAALEADRNSCLRRNDDLTAALDAAAGREQALLLQLAAKTALATPKPPNTTAAPSSTSSTPAATGPTSAYVTSSLSESDRDAKQRHVVKMLRDELTSAAEQRLRLMAHGEQMQQALDAKDDTVRELQGTIEDLERKVLELGLRKTPPPSPAGHHHQQQRPLSPTRAAPPPMRHFPSAVPIIPLRPIVAHMVGGEAGPADGPLRIVRHPSPTIGIVRNRSPSASGGSQLQHGVGSTKHHPSPTPRSSAGGGSSAAAAAPLLGRSSATPSHATTKASSALPKPRAASPAAVRQHLASASFLQATQSARQRLDGLNRPNVMARPRIAVTSSPIARRTVAGPPAATTSTAIVTSATGAVMAGGCPQPTSRVTQQTRVTPVRTASPFQSAQFETTTFRPTRMVRHNDWNEPQ